MILLAADTSGKNGSLALVRILDPLTPGALEELEVFPLAGGMFSAQLIPQAADMLARHGFGKHDIAAFAVASGPGSFTGLRVGLAAIKALAEILQKPIAAVSLLEAVARAREAQGRVLAALDAGRGEVYAGEYALGEDPKVISERLLTRDEFLATARSAPLVVTPDESIASLARQAGLHVQEIFRPDSSAIARLGWEKIQSGHTVSPEQLDANYLRRSDAEIFAKGSG
jgi:tRNA threonylcarbamoyladenosine biosynthesis protein TsaB